MEVSLFYGFRCALYNPESAYTTPTLCGHVRLIFLLLQGSVAEAELQSVAETRSLKRQRKLDRVEIPEDQLFITDDLLGKGGFGEVYLADYNGHNAAVKVCAVGSMSWTILSNTWPSWTVMLNGLKSSVGKGYLA